MWAEGCDQFCVGDLACSVSKPGDTSRHINQLEAFTVDGQDAEAVIAF